MRLKLLHSTIFPTFFRLLVVGGLRASYALFGMRVEFIQNSRSTQWMMMVKSTAPSISLGNQAPGVVAKSSISILETWNEVTPVEESRQE